VSAQLATTFSMARANSAALGSPRDEVAGYARHRSIRDSVGARHDEMPLNAGHFQIFKECDREAVRDSPTAARVDTWIPVRKPG